MYDKLGNHVVSPLPTYNQCDQIGRFIGLWASFKSLWQQLFCPNLPCSSAFFAKVSKSIIFLVKSFLDNFYRHLAIFFWSHYLQLTIWKVGDATAYKWEAQIALKSVCLRTRVETAEGQKCLSILSTWFFWTDAAWLPNEMVEIKVSLIK